MARLIRPMVAALIVAALVPVVALAAYAGSTARSTGRLAGASRVETAVAISRHAFPGGAVEVYLSRQDVNPDALAAGSLSAGPVLLVPQCGELPGVVADEIARLNPERVFALGGPAAVCDQMLAQAGAVPGSGTSPSPTPSPSPSPSPAPAPGTRDDPYPVGTDVKLDDGWVLTVIGGDANANEEVEAHNQFNDPPDEGKQFFMARVRLTYEGEGSDTFFAGFRLDAVGDSNVAYHAYECGDIPDELPYDEVFKGGTIEGNVCWEIETSDVASLLMFDREGDPRPFFDLPREDT